MNYGYKHGRGKVTVNLWRRLPNGERDQPIDSATVAARDNDEALKKAHEIFLKRHADVETNFMEVE